MKKDKTTRLEDILQLKKNIDQAIVQKEQAALDQKQESDAKKRAAQEAWKASRIKVAKAVEQINADLQTTNLRLVIQEEKEEDVYPAIARLSIILKQPGVAKDCRMVLNVNGIGTAIPGFLIPHSGQAPGKFEVGNVNMEHYENIVLDFIRQVLDHRQLELTKDSRLAKIPS